jgi:ATP-dependent DNA ligase
MSLQRVQPIIPTWRKEPFDDPELLFDFKYDGFRGLCYIERGRFMSRNGNVLCRFEALGDQRAAVLQIDEAIIDGEVVAVDEIGRPQFYDLLRRAQAPAYVAFDLLWEDGADLRSLPLSERRKRLRAILPAQSPVICEALSVIVAERLDHPYEPRVRWLKIKNGDYSQKDGRSDLFNRPRQPPAHSAW